MHPVLFKIGPLSIHTYGFLLAVGVLSSIIFCLKLAKKEGFDTSVFSDLLFYAILSGLIGAKLILLITDFKLYWKNPAYLKDILVSGGIFQFGLLFGAAFAMWYLRKKKMNVRKVGDIIAPGLALAHFFGRMGCFFAGCCWGRPAEGSFCGVTYTNPDCQTGIPLNTSLFPTQVFEAVFNLFNFIVLVWIYKKKKLSGQVFVFYIFNYSLFRFFIEYFRGDSNYIFGQMSHPFTSLSMAQLISLSGIAIALITFAKFKKNPQ